MQDVGRFLRNWKLGEAALLCEALKQEHEFALFVDFKVTKICPLWLHVLENSQRCLLPETIAGVWKFVAATLKAAQLSHRAKAYNLDPRVVLKLHTQQRECCDRTISKPTVTFRIAVEAKPALVRPQAQNISNQLLPVETPI